MSKLRIAINGAAGRMGRRIIALASVDPHFQVIAALEFPEHPQIGQDAGEVAGVGPLGVLLTSHLNTDVDVLIDFSVPESADAITEICVARNIPLVMATTGFTPAQKERLAQAATTIPLVWAPNMSLAVNLAMRLAAAAAACLKEYPEGADVEIIERHHRFKEDAPSGTALRFGEIIAGVMGQAQHVHGRSGRPGSRTRHEIGYHALRVGDNPGEHTIVFGMLGETLELTVRASNRDCYAQGALAAARFVAGRQPGHYTMYDVLDHPAPINPTPTA